METVAKQIEQACEEFCNSYCRWPYDERYKPENDNDDEMFNLLDKEHCSSCPINKLI